jgi:hypothetical protein
MNWTIGKRLGFGFGFLMLILAIAGFVGIRASLKTEHFAEVQMESATKAADGAMESRINYLSLIWGTLEASNAFDGQSQKEGLEHVKRGAVGFPETMTLLKESGLVPDKQIEEIKTIFQGLKEKGEELVDDAIKTKNFMEKLDGSVAALVENGIAGAGGMSPQEVNLA